MIISYININSIRNKFLDIECLLKDKVDILTIAESKLDKSFPEKQFMLSGYKKPLRFDDTSRSGGLLVYINENIPSRHLNLHSFQGDIQIIVFEINLRKQKWITFSVYRPPKQNLLYFLNALSLGLDKYTEHCENFLITGDINSTPSDKVVVDFLSTNNLHNMHSFKTCWKSSAGTCIDLFLTNKKFSFQHTGVCETGISDHHGLVYTMLKSTFIKLPPKRYLYRSYKNFVQCDFILDLEMSLHDSDSQEYSDFESIFHKVLTKHAPLKTKILRGNNQSHLTKELRKAIMKRSYLKNLAIKTNCDISWANYKAQRNLVVKLNRNAKKFLFNSIDPKTSQKGFWKTFKPLFSNKVNNVEERIILVDNGDIVSDDQKLATINNSYYNTVTEKLNIHKWNENFVANHSDKVNIAIEKYSSHPSIITIKNKIANGDSFVFREISSHEAFSEIAKLKRDKKTSGNIPVSILQLANRESPSVSSFLAKCFNNCLKLGTFPDELTWADVVPVHKKDSTADKSNYRPISLLPAISKVFERLIFNQLSVFFETKLSKFLCGFRKRYSTQHAIINLIKDWQKALDNSEKVGAVLMDLSKAYDTLPHDLLIAKLAAYGLDYNSLKYLYSYLSNRKQRVRVGSSLSEWLCVLLGVPQGSILGPLLFNIFINDLLIFLCDYNICNFADDNTISACNSSINRIVEELNSGVDAALQWFKLNPMVANPDKFQVLVVGNKNGSFINLEINGCDIESTSTVKLLGVTLDNKLSFLPHVKNICKTATIRTKALMPVRGYLNQTKAFHLSNSYILSLFNYCQIVWMFCGKQGNTLINKTHKRCLRTVLYDYEIPYEEALTKTESIPIHEKNLQILMKEMYRSINSLNPEFMWDIFSRKRDTVLF